MFFGADLTMDENMVVKNLILYLFDSISEKDYKGLNKFRTHKLLFKLKTELSDDHPLKEKIPYYWYFHGPYSEIVNTQINQLNSDYIKTNEHNLFYLNKSIKESDISKIIDDEVINIIENLLEPKNFYNIDKIVYEEDAPYEFMPLYKLKFIKELEEYVKSVKYNNTNSHLLTEIIERYYELKVTLPLEPLFKDFNDIFLIFSADLNRVFEYHDDNLNYLERTLKNTARIWKTFAYGIRINHHDKYYDSRVNDWKRIFLTDLSKLKTIINRFDNFTIKEIQVEEIEFSDISKRILSSTVGNYKL